MDRPLQAAGCPERPIQQSAAAHFPHAARINRSVKRQSFLKCLKFRGREEKARTLAPSVLLLAWASGQKQTLGARLEASL